ncbi:MAG: hypothetical protein HDT22_08865 [Ruminococcus sp.]|nr:hypothetical protein [Ruminococcus sp.]
MKKYSIITGIFSLCLVLTGCGRTKINLNDYLTVNYDGYETVGTASSSFDMEKMISENPSAFGLKGEISEMELLGVEIILDESLNGSLDKTNGLSNGNKITYHWEIAREDSLKEKYPVSFVHEDTTYTIEGLEPAKEFDPFEGITVTFRGIAPFGKVSIDESGEDPYLIYDADKTSGLKNGDTIKVTVDGLDMCPQFGKIPTVEEKEYTVEGLTSYVTTLDEIPDDMKEKMQNQAYDSFISYSAGLTNIPDWQGTIAIQEPEFLGYYFLTGKEGFTPNPYNDLYLVYKYTANINALKKGSSSSDKVQGDETYYFYYHYSDIQNLPDGTCSVDLSSGQLCEKSSESEYDISISFLYSSNLRGIWTLIACSMKV